MTSSLFMTDQLLPGGLHLAVSAAYGRRDEELRVDLDGAHADDVISGVLHGRHSRLAWHAHVVTTTNGTWEGLVVHDDGDARLLPHTHVEVGLVRRSRLTGGRGSATATFRGGGVPTATRTYAWSGEL